MKGVTILGTLGVRNTDRAGKKKNGGSKPADLEGSRNEIGKLQICSCPKKKRKVDGGVGRRAWEQTKFKQSSGGGK